jgi:transposase InsO family protein
MQTASRSRIAARAAGNSSHRRAKGLQSAENGYAERVIRMIKEEEVYLNDYRDLQLQGARARIGRFVDDVYLSKRIYSSLGYLTPAEFKAQWLEQQKATATKTKAQ